MDPTEEKFSNIPTGISIHLLLVEHAQEKKKKGVREKERHTDYRFLRL